MWTDSRTGAAAAFRRGRTILNVLVNLMEREPTLGKDAAFKKWDKTITSDDNLQQESNLHTFTRLWESLTKREETTRDERVEYVGVVHKAAGGDYGVSFPDLPGVVAAAPTMEAARAQAEESLTLHIRDLASRGKSAPKPSKLEKIMANERNREGVAVMMAARPARHVMSPEERRARETEVASIAKKVIRQLTLDFIMPNGKKLRECTGLECAKFGGWFKSIGAKAGKRLVGDAIKSDEDLQKVIKL